MKQCTFLAAILFCITGSLFSQIPQTISWQGILQDADSKNLSGTFSLTVKLFDVASGGTAIWNETHSSVVIADGLVNLTLGSVTPFSVNFADEYWLEITVGSGTPLPRLKLSSVPYALHSKTAESFNETDPTWSGNANTSGTISRSGKVGIGTNSPTALLHTHSDGGGNVLFSGQINFTDPSDPPVSGEGTRMMWYPDKAAFRAGFVSGNQWDKDNVGFYSVALGGLTKASGYASTAMGGGTTASGGYSTVMGYSSTASGNYSTAIGALANASGNTSVAMNYSTTAQGNNATAMGEGTIASSFSSLAIGCNNIGGGSANTWIPTDPIFEIGIGTYELKKNALTVLKNGNTGIGTASPLAILHTHGTGTGEGNVLFVGAMKTPAGPPPASGEGTRMMWYADYAAFRAGVVQGNEWDQPFIGKSSVAMGNNTSASGNQSTALGMGSAATAYASTAIGNYTSASGGSSIAMGAFTSAIGDASTAMGFNTIAGSYCGTAIGRYNVVGGNATSWVATDPLFEIGNGTSTTSRSNAFTVLKNGQVGIGISTPLRQLHINSENIFTGLMITNNASGTTINDGFHIGQQYQDNTTNRYALILNRENTHLVIGTNNKSDGNIVILPNGNIGIGTSSPGAGLHLKGTNFPESFLFIESNTGNDAGIRLYEGSTVKWHIFNNPALDGLFIYNTGGTTALFAKQSNAFIGIGTSSPSQRLDVNGNARFRSISSGAYAGVVNRTSDGTLTTATSDIRFKENIETLENSLERVMQLRGVSFTWKSNPEYGTRIGFIAQEFEKVMPELAFINPTDGYMGINYAEMTAVLAEAIKEQQAIIDEQNKRIDKQLTINEEQNKRIEELEKKLEQLLHKFSENK